ncbi:MAG: hypothetical protein HC933_01375 [Pleurocapsa sp. SU_196_0]|nr:hypothetical protein [Pleurocapsa sp. SU_196_0]
MTLKAIGIGVVLLLALVGLVLGVRLLFTPSDLRAELSGKWARQLSTGPNEALYRDDTITFAKDDDTVSVLGYRDLFKGTYTARRVNGGIELEIFYGNSVFARASVRGSEMTVNYTFFQPATFKKK